MYNTGRALHKCQELFEEKREVLPAPDYLITSVGTKVCFLIRICFLASSRGIVA